MAVRYRQEMLNIADVYYKIEILDSSYTGSVLDFHLKDFEIDWKGQQSERDNFILGSECIVMVQSTSTYDINPLMDDIRESEEGRFQIAIYKKELVTDTYELHWIGMVLNDLSGGEDAAPVQHFDLVATDGLGALKGIEYRVDSVTAYGDLSAATHLINCLKKIPYQSFFGSSDIFLMEIVHLYESAMANITDSVLSRVQVPGATFYEIDKNGNYEWKSCYEVLELLTVLFKSRLYLENGIWRFGELYSLENENSAAYFQYQYNGTENTYKIVDWEDLTGVSLSNDGKTITKTDSSDTWNASAVGSDLLAVNVDGWVEMEAIETNTLRMFGLAQPNSGSSINIDYAFRLRNAAVIQIFETGTNKGNFGTYATGDKFRVERIGTTVTYYHNGSLIYTSLVASATNLVTDIVLKTPNATIYNSLSSFGCEQTLRQDLTGGFDGGNRLTGQRFEWLPALKEAKQTYLHKSSDNLLKTIINTTSGQQRILDGVPNTGTESLLLSANLDVSVVEDPLIGSNIDVYIKFRLTFSVSAYYYVRTVLNQNENSDYTNAKWQTALGYVEFISVQNVNYSGSNTIAFAFQTPPLVSNGPLDMNLEVVYVQDLQQNDISSNYNVSAVLNAAYLEYIDGDAENKRIYQALNDSTSFYSAVAEFPDALCGDRITPMTPNNLKVWDGAAWVESTGTWERDGLSGTSTLLQLTLKEFLGGQRKFIKKRQGEFIGHFNPLLAIGFGSEYYLPLGVNFRANDAVFSGDWYKIDEYDGAGIVGIGQPISVINLLPPSVNNVPPISQTGATGVNMTDGKLQIENLSTRAVAIELNSDHSYSTAPFGVGTSNKYASAILHADSTTRGFLLPRMTEVQKDAISSPETGLMVYQTDGTAGVYVYGGSGWDKL